MDPCSDHGDRHAPGSVEEPIPGLPTLAGPVAGLAVLSPCDPQVMCGLGGKDQEIAAELEPAGSVHRRVAGGGEFPLVGHHATRGIDLCVLRRLGAIIVAPSCQD